MIKMFRALLLVGIALLLFSGAAYAFDGAVVKKVDIDVDGEAISLNTTRGTVAEVLTDAGITLSKDDVVTPDGAALIKDGMKINVAKAFLVTVTVDGTPRRLKVSKGQIKTAKEKIEQAVNVKTSLVGAELTDALVPDMTIELVTSYTVREEEERAIPFETVYVENAEVDEGIETVLAEGADGVAVTVFESLFEGDKLISRLPVETIVTRQKADKVIEIGTKPLKPIVPDVPEMKLYYTQVYTMNATAYTTDRGDSGPITATGEKTRVGLVAVDPRVIPLGTMLYVEGYGVCRAADTGGAIKGHKIDLYFDTYNECVSFGRRNITVYVLEATRDELFVTGFDSNGEFVLEAA